jgi:hypothetical protein
MSKFKFTLRRNPSFESHYCIVRDLVYGTSTSSMKVGEICYQLGGSEYPGGKRFLASAAWDGSGYTPFAHEKEAREYLEDQFTETFLGGKKDQ